MTIQEVLLPLFLEVILTFALLFWLAPLRAAKSTEALYAILIGEKNGTGTAAA